MFFSSGVAVKFGQGVHHSLGQEVARRGWRRVLLFTDPGLQETGHATDVLSIIKEEGIECSVFSGVSPNPNLPSVFEGLKAARSFQPQALAALGGGSVLDSAKAVGIWYTNPGKGLLELADPENRQETMLPVITLPTTAGTGSEVSSWAVITDDDVPEKVSIGGQGMSPTLALVDPLLTVTLPEKMTLWTGLDAFTHALEAFLAKGTNPFIQQICLLSLQQIFTALPVVLQDGGDVQAREELMLGSLLAGWAMENAGLGLIHGMSHQVSAYYNYQHGLTNALLLPVVLDFNGDDCSEEFTRINQALFGEGELLDNLDGFYRDLGFAQGLQIKEGDLLGLSRQALENINTQGNPKPVDLQRIMGLYRRAFLVEK